MKDVFTRCREDRDEAREGAVRLEREVKEERTKAEEERRRQEEEIQTLEGKIEEMENERRRVRDRWRIGVLRCSFEVEERNPMATTSTLSTAVMMMSTIFDPWHVPLLTVRHLHQSVPLSQGSLLRGKCP